MRFPSEVVERLDAYVDWRRRREPGLLVTRTDVVRAAALAGFEPMEREMREAAARQPAATAAASAAARAESRRRPRTGSKRGRKG